MTNQTVVVEQVDIDLADAIANALSNFAVAYSHDTLADMSTANRSWKVHETGHGNPFDHGVWLGEFDSKQEANAFCAELRRNAAYQAAAQARTPHPLADEMLGVLRKLVAKIDECAPHVGDAFLHRELRCGPYDGPSYAEELAAARTLIAKVEAGEGESGLCATCGKGPGFHAHAPFNEEWHEFTPPASPQSEKGL